MSYYYLLISSFILNIYAGTIRTDSIQQYQNQTIHCTANEPCNILCQHEDSCQKAQIYCPTDYPCNVLCQQNTACANAIIHAEYTSLFRLLDCGTGSFTCRGINIYFPPNDHGTPRASIIGADTGLSAGPNLTQTLQFYAIYGWNDINITTSASFTYRYHAGTMHCAHDLRTTCDFNTNQWQCANADDICNNPILSPLVTMTQTEIAQRQFSVSPHSLSGFKSNLLYAIIAILMGCLCCFGFILVYYMYYSEEYTTKLASSSSMSMKPIPSISRMTNSTVISPASVPSLDSISPNSKPIKISINGTNDDDQSPEITALNNKHSDDSVSESPERVTNTGPWPIYYPVSNPMQLQPPHYPSQLIAIQQPPHVAHRISTSSLPSNHERISLSSGHERILYQHGAPPQHALVPSTSFQTSVSSANEQQIIYQQPSQQQMMHMMSMMNHSNPPSLSSFVKNGNDHYIMNQQPIEPSAASSCDSVCVQPRRVTITSERHMNDDHLLVPPPGSILSAFTSATLSSRNLDPPLSERSQPDDNHGNHAETSSSESNLDAMYVD